MTRAAAATLVLAALGGCAVVPFRHHHAPARGSAAAAPVTSASAAIVVGDPTLGGGCRLDLLNVLIGRPGSAVLAAEALDLSGARSIRWMHPGEAVTMDYRADRLDIKLTHGNIVKSFACG